MLKIRVVRDPRPFNYSELNNSAAAAATGDILVFLNNDTEIIDGSWLRRIVEFAEQETVGAVGLKLVYRDRKVQHGGMVLGVFERINRGATHAHVRIESEDPGYNNLANLTHEVSAVTGACLAIRASLFREIGGFGRNLQGSFNDVVLCLDLLARGYRNIYIGECALIHHESRTRGRIETAEQVTRFLAEARFARERYPDLFLDDRYYNPNLSLRRIYGLAFPPRRTYPWLRHAVSESGEQLRPVHFVGHVPPQHP